MSCPLPVHVDWWRLLNDDADPGAVDKKNLQPFLTKAIFKEKKRFFYSVIQDSFRNSYWAIIICDSG